MSQKVSCCLSLRLSCPAAVLSEHLLLQLTRVKLPDYAVFHAGYVKILA